MSDITPHNYFQERLDRVEREVEAHRTLIAGLVTKTAVFDEVVKNIHTILGEMNTKLTSTNSTITWATRIVIGAVLTIIVAGAVTYVS